MADKKISALTSASTPLAGTEVFPLVQSGSTVKTPVSSVITSNLTASFGAVTATVSGIPAITAIRDLDVGVVGDAGQTIAMGARNGATPIAGTDILGTLEVGGVTGRFAVRTLTSGTMSTKFTVSSAGDVTANIGNLVIGTAAKGIDFSANTGTAGMTSELLNWYEEGTWTPNQGGGLVVVGAFSSSGTYTRIGRVVTVQATLTGATSISWASGAAVLFTNLPFAAASGREFTGRGHNSGYTTSFSVITAGTSTVFSIEAQGAIAIASITLTYFV
jgi:hypothetical protein